MSLTAWPTSWEDVSWTADNPANLDQARCIYLALVERAHAIRGVAGAVPPQSIPTPSQYMSRSWYAAIRDSIIGMASSFVDLDYDYATNHWQDFPKMLSAQTLLADDSRNISNIPPIYSPAAYFIGWLAKAKACLDLMIATIPTIGVRSYNYQYAYSAEFSTLSAAIADAQSDATASTLASDNSRKTARRWWDCKVRNPDGTARYYAETQQYYNTYFKHVSPLSAIPVIVARGWTHSVDDPIFDAVGTSWAEGPNVLTALTANESRSLDTDSTVYAPDTTPTLTVPPIGVTVNYKVIGYELLSYLDWRTAGGFKFYTPEV